MLKCCAAPEILCLQTYPQINNLVTEIQKRGKTPKFALHSSVLSKSVEYCRFSGLTWCSSVSDQRHIMCPSAQLPGQMGCLYLSVSRGVVIQHILHFFQRTDVRSQSSSAQISFQLACSKPSACNWLLLWGSVLQEELEYRKTCPPWSRTRLRNIYTNWIYTNLWCLIQHSHECQVSWQMLLRGHTLFLKCHGEQGRFPRTKETHSLFPLHFFIYF